LHGPDPAGGNWAVTFWGDAVTIPGYAYDAAAGRMTSTPADAAVKSWPWIGNTGFSPRCAASDDGAPNNGGLLGFGMAGAARGPEHGGGGAGSMDCEAEPPVLSRAAGPNHIRAPAHLLLLLPRRPHGRAAGQVQWRRADLPWRLLPAGPELWQPR
jgi:hypothetical protein